LVHLCNNGKNSSAMEHLALIYERYPQAVVKALKKENKNFKEWEGKFKSILNRTANILLQHSPLNKLVDMINCRGTLGKRAAKEMIGRLYSEDPLASVEAAKRLSRLFHLARTLAAERKRWLFDLIETAAKEFIL